MDENEQLPEFADGSLIPDPVVETPVAVPVVKPEMPLSPIGITKASHEESKKRKRMAAKSRKINRRK